MGGRAESVRCEMGAMMPFSVCVRLASVGSEICRQAVIATSASIVLRNSTTMCAHLGVYRWIEVGMSRNPAKSDAHLKGLLTVTRRLRSSSTKRDN